MSAIAIVGAVLGGGTLGVVAKSARDIYVARTRREEHAERTAAKASAREDDITRETALEDRSDRRRMEQEIRVLRDELTEAKVANARLEAERNRLREDHGDRDTLLELVATLRTQVDMQSQLIERQKTQIDDLVRRLMTRTDSVPPGGIS